VAEICTKSARISGDRYTAERNADLRPSTPVHSSRPFQSATWACTCVLTALNRRPMTGWHLAHRHGLPRLPKAPIKRLWPDSGWRRFCDLPEKWSPKAKTPDEANTSETAVEAAHTKCMFQTRSVFGNAQHCGHHLWGNMMAFGLGSPDVETRKCGIDSFTYGVRGGVHTGDRRRG
jgi:hypothetical protein